MDIGLNWNEWHQEAARKPYVRVGVTLLSGALILMSAQEIVSLYLEKNLISEIEVCATTEDINVSGNDLPEKVTITKQIKEPEKMDKHSFLSAETIRTDVNQADVIQVAAVPAEILVEEPMVEEIAVEEPVVEEIVAEKPGVKRDTTINVASEPVITNPDSMENVKNENEDEEGSIAVGNTDTGYLINAEGMICGLSANIVIITLIIGYCIFLIYKGYKNHKEGKHVGCAGCSGNCGSCGGCSAAAGKSQYTKKK